MAVSKKAVLDSGPKPARRPRADGVRSREAILNAAAKLATQRGLSGLSIGDLAQHLGMSKSGLFAHFGSKEELELATIETAEQVFTADVIDQVIASPPGLARLDVLSSAFLSHLQRKVFPGGCFFASGLAELDTRPGRARDRVWKFTLAWLGLIERCLTEAKQAGEIRAETDIAQTVFEAEAMLSLANCVFVMTGDAGALERARTGIAHLIARIAAKPKNQASRPKA